MYKNLVKDALIKLKTIRTEEELKKFKKEYSKILYNARS